MVGSRGRCPAAPARKPLEGWLLACSGPATETDDPPTAAITAPADASSVVAGTPLRLEGVAVDPSEPARDLTARWFVDDLEGCPGSVPTRDGAVVCETTAPAGSAMEVRLEVTDAAGQAAVARVGLTVTPGAAPDNLAPTCTITSEAGTSVVGERVALAGTAADPDGAVERLTVQWVSDRDGVLGASTPTSAGEVELTTDLLGVGVQPEQTLVTDPGAPPARTASCGPCWSPRPSRSTFPWPAR